MILLDTHVLVWFRSYPRRLSPRARRTITRAGALAVCDITLWEIAMLARKSRIVVTGSLERYLTDLASSMHVLPVNPAVAAAVANLADDFPTRDPADQIIYATASVHGVPLVSADRHLRAYDDSVVWS